MQGRLLLKLLSKIPRNGNASTTKTNSLFSSTFFKTNSSPFHQHSFSEISTLSRSHFCNPNAVSGKIQIGVLWSSVLTRRCLSNTLFKGRSKFSVGVHTRRNFHSFDSQNRGWRSVSRRFEADGVVQGLILTNVAVFLLWKIAGRKFMRKNFMISIDNFTSGRLHTLITCAFSHNKMSHLLCDMIALYFFGKRIGQTFGPQYLLKLYLSGAVAGSIFYLVDMAIITSLLQKQHMFGFDHSKVAGLGASGAVNAIALLYFLRIAPVPAIAILGGLFIIGLDIWMLQGDKKQGDKKQGDKKVSGAAHFGGVTVGALAWIQSKRGGRFRRL